MPRVEVEPGKAWSATCEFDEETTQGDITRTSAYLHRQHYLSGPSVNEQLKRKRRRARRLARRMERDSMKQRTETDYDPRAAGFRRLRTHDCRRAGCAAKSVMADERRAEKAKKARKG
ncbi:MAG TPA: hypothetical protein VM537_26545 [Anaerolineae bacterium]|nr:hypothetical protein [Anaerolineae bacterium]